MNLDERLLRHFLWQSLSSVTTFWGWMFSFKRPKVTWTTSTPTLVRLKH